MCRTENAVRFVFCAVLLGTPFACAEDDSSGGALGAGGADAYTIPPTGLGGRPARSGTGGKPARSETDATTAATDATTGAIGIGGHAPSSGVGGATAGGHDAATAGKGGLPNNSAAGGRANLAGTTQVDAGTFDARANGLGGRAFGARPEECVSGRACVIDLEQLQTNPDQIYCQGTAGTCSCELSLATPAPTAGTTKIDGIWQCNTSDTGAALGSITCPGGAKLVDNRCVVENAYPPPDGWDGHGAGVGGSTGSASPCTTTMPLSGALCGTEGQVCQTCLCAQGIWTCPE